jgi:hypothetical protein
MRDDVVIVRGGLAATGAEAHVPFGGIGASAWEPREQGPATIELSKRVATIYLDA